MSPLLGQSCHQAVEPPVEVFDGGVVLQVVVVDQGGGLGLGPVVEDAPVVAGVALEADEEASLQAAKAAVESSAVIEALPILLLPGP